MESLLRVTFLLLLCVSVYCSVHFEIEPIDMATTSLSVSEATFDNIIDHFTNRQSGTYKQRYWEMRDFWDPTVPRALLYICGEGPCRFPNEKALPVVAAQELKAAVYALEHRFYGQSQPAKDWTLNSLKLLTHEQALADIAYFIESMNKKINATEHVIPKWIVIGGSYPGALSAWMRLKYGHLVLGSIASSGVVTAVGEFEEYERQMAIDLNKCEGGMTNWTTLLIRKYQQYADSQMLSPNPQDKKDFLALFNATDMDLLDFSYYFADIPVSFIQPSKRLELCPILAELNQSSAPLRDQIKKLADIAASRGHTTGSYKFARLRNTTIDFGSSSRQWYYQVCTTFGWFQCQDPEYPLRWTGMNLTYWLRYCNAIYGEALYPDEVETNHQMAGDRFSPYTSNTFFTQGVEDGWKWAGVRDNFDENPDIEVVEIACEGCAHCTDLKAATDNDPEAVRNVRKKEIAAMQKWFTA